MDKPVGIIMGSQSDWSTMREAAQILDRLGVAYEAASSAPSHADRLWDYGKTAWRGLCGSSSRARGAAHLPGMMASRRGGAGDRRAGQTKALSGRRFALFHRADAQGLSGRHHGHRRAGRGQCRADGGGDSGDFRPRAGGAAGCPGARPVRSIPQEPRMTELAPVRPSASWAAASWGACSVAASRLGYRCHIYEPAAAPAGDVFMR